MIYFSEEISNSSKTLNILDSQNFYVPKDNFDKFLNKILYDNMKENNYNFLYMKFNAFICQYICILLFIVLIFINNKYITSGILNLFLYSCSFFCYLIFTYNFKKENIKQINTNIFKSFLYIMQFIFLNKIFNNLINFKSLSKETILNTFFYMIIILIQTFCIRIFYNEVLKYITVIFLIIYIFLCMINREIVFVIDLYLFYLFICMAIFNFKFSKKMTIFNFKFFKKRNKKLL
jgi:hypothetical protein